jgi:tRNA-Thr(GGU) m(6)t(6)A37 methyltransferase TsaA
MKIIARIHTDFKEKFGIPRQSGLSRARGKIVFEKPYRNPDALRGIEEFSHLWIIWQFSEAIRDKFTPTVRPPRLGGNKKVGVFATRSPFRPNPIGLSSVKLVGVSEEAGLGTVLYVEGADMLDGTPIYDIKPYITYSDSHPDAKSSFAEKEYGKKLTLEIPEELTRSFSEEELSELRAILEEDPRPSYQDDNEREYGMFFGEREIFFKVDGDVLTICGIK